MTRSKTPTESVPTARELIDRAIALRPKLIEQQAAVEERTYYSPEMHEEFQRAGFYRMFMPRRYGGYEVDVPTFMQVFVEIARGCPSTAWCLALASNHALMVGSWFPQEAQDEVFDGGRFICASVAAPLSEPAVKVDSGWELNGKVSFCSGIPYSTYFLGQALTPGDGSGAPGPMLLYVAPKGAWRMLDDWGEILGFKGSGSQSIVFEHARIPEHYVLEATSMIDVNVGAGTPGVTPARQPHVRWPGPRHLHDVPCGRHGRRRLQRPRRVRGADGVADDADPSVRAAAARPRLPALLRRRPGQDRDRRGRAPQLRGAAHGALSPSRPRRASPTPTRTTCCSAASAGR